MKYKIMDILNKYQSNGTLLQNTKCIDPMDFHKIANDILKLTDWISVKEKLPPEYDNILIINSDLEMFVTAYDPIMNDFEGFYGTVTHWRFIF